MEETFHNLTSPAVQEAKKEVSATDAKRLKADFRK